MAVELGGRDEVQLARVRLALSRTPGEIDTRGEREVPEDRTGLEVSGVWDEINAPMPTAVRGTGL